MPESLRTYLRYTNWPIILAMAALMCIGISAIQVSQKADPSVRNFASSQAVFAMVGLAAFVGATMVPYQRVGRLAYVMFALTLLVLLMLVVARYLPSAPPMLPRVRGSHRWVDLRVVKFQPSEVAKITYVIMLAWYLRYGDHYRRIRGLVPPFIMTFVPMVLILKEPDLGTSLLFLPTLYFMLFMAGARLRHLLSIVAVGTAMLLLPVPKKLSAAMDPSELQDSKALAYCTFRTGSGQYALTAAPLALMEHHQLKRIDGWLRQNDDEVARNKGYQLHQSKMVIGAGCLTGRGEWNDADSFFRMLPDDHTDFIFSVIGGQWGFAGCACVLLLYGAIFLFGVEVAVGTHEPFGRLLAVGMLALLFSQVCINVGMTMGLMPITGMTLPLVSYGGSSLVVNCAAMGLLVNVARHRPILLGKRPFEHGQKRQRPPGVAVARSGT